MTENLHPGRTSNHFMKLIQRMTYAVTPSHLFPNNFQKMKVKLASQVLKHTVYSAICTGVSTGQPPPGEAATAELVEKFDQIFDSLKSDCLQKSNIPWQGSNFRLRSNFHFKLAMVRYETSCA